MPTADIELTIARASNQPATAALRVELPTRRADLAPPAPITLDDTALRALTAIPAAYGAALTAMVFSPALREAWQRARGFAEGANAMRVRLVLEGDDRLHAIRWELLRDPVDGSPLAHAERTPFSRFLASPSLADLQAPSRPALRAVVAVASPSALPAFGMAPIDAPGEVARAQAGLGDIPATILDGIDGRPAASLAAIAAAMRGEAHILYLVCHGALNGGQPMLYLEPAGDGRYQPTAGADLVQQIAQLARRPLLVVLGSCQGAGDNYQLLAAVGPQLARVGVGAVIAMQGNVPMELVAALTPRLFEELRRDGQIDRALAAARAALPAASPWWMPTLWMAVRDGALWRAEAAAPAPPPTQVGGVSIGGNVGTVQVVNVSGGSVGSIVGSQHTYGSPAAHVDQTAGLRQRLDAHRATLAHYLGQLAIMGSAYAPPAVSAGIREARREIRRIKAALRAAGQTVEDQLDDEGA
jgi:hypothetical protein